MTWTVRVSNPGGRADVSVL